jgi:hypothetical protein
VVIDQQTLTKVLTKVEAGELSERESNLLFRGLTQEINRKCAEDGLFWLKFARTRDEADTDNPVKLVPLHEEYVRDIWNAWLTHKVSALVKSRQMFASWELALFMTWWARYKPHQSVYYQTQTWPDAVMMTSMPKGGHMGRCQFIEANLPDWMRLPVKETEGRLEYPNGSIIQALAGGANQVRGKTPSLYAGDEYAFMEDQDKIWTSVAPLLQKGSKIILVSTPNGTGNMFATLWHGRNVGEELAA